MAVKYPVVHYACPCTDISDSHLFGAQQKSEQEEQSTFNPTSLRANYNLYFLDNLLFCNECNEIRCPRCYFDEVVTYYCPSCTLETPASVVKAESNRCSRNCFQCPVCIGPLALQSYIAPNENGDKVESSSVKDGAFILMCPYCTWSSLEISITFEKSVNISAQLAKLPNDVRKLHDGGSQDLPSSMTNKLRLTDSEAWKKDQFNDLTAFYRNQLSDASIPGPLSLTHGYGLDSPTQLSRLLSSYGVSGLGKNKGNSSIIREANSTAEGLRAPSDENGRELDSIRRMSSKGWQGSTSLEQRAMQTSHARFLPDFRPIPMQLRSKRTKRCRTCRHILVKPEEKRSTARYKIRLVALNYIPSITVRPFSGSDINLKGISRAHQTQFLLSLRNPLFDPVRVTISTPRALPNAAGSRVTILCPQFEIGATKDMFEDALEDANRDRRSAQDYAKAGAESQQQQAPEAGKVWEQGRNWTAVVLEVYAGSPEPASEIKVALHVRVEYETDESEAAGKSVKEKKVQKELSFWTSLTLGRLLES